MAYIVVKPKDHDAFTVAANVHGFWTVKGLHDGKMDYDRNGDAFPTLVALIKHKSAHFNATIDKQVRYVARHSTI